ncbi:MAG: tryptophan synthase subunit alpha [Acidimicrobiia bacterium]
MTGALEARLRSRRDAGAKLLVPYLTGGLDDEWVDVLGAVADAGADAVEIGIPFSDPVMDGPVIQRASQQALLRGATPHSVIAEASKFDADVPLAVMTYVNLVGHMGYRRFAAALVDAGIAAAILPDLPLDELGPWAEAADAHGIETVLLAAPTTPDDRLRAICARSRGFLYAVSLLGVTGERDSLATRGAELARRCRAVTDLPVLLGVGISNAELAVEACEHADGVVIGSALVRRILDGGGPDAAGAFVAEVRAALDARWPTRSDP